MCQPKAADAPRPCIRIVCGTLGRQQSKLWTCLLNAAIAAGPVFINSFLDCMLGGNGNGEEGDPYTPGDRVRCPQT